MGQPKIVSASSLLLRRVLRRLLVRVSLMAALAFLASVAAMLFEEALPAGLRDRFGAEAVMPILTILASGMLAVSTFSLNVMVSAHRAAAAQATPRAHRVLLSDTTTQTVLATFIGAFVYALSAILLLQAGLYADGSAVMVMGMTTLVVVLVIVAMLRWIDHLSDLGSMDATLRATGAKAYPVLMQTRQSPALGARRLTDDITIPTDSAAICAPGSGYIQVINLEAISAALPDEAARVWITCPPGKFVLEGQPIGRAAGLSDKALVKIQEAITLGADRTFEQDATYGVLVLSEIASRALSPGINDSGTAIDVIAHQEKLLWAWANTPADDSLPEHPAVFAHGLEPADLIESAFGSIARDGAGKTEVVIRLLHALETLQGTPDAELSDAARKMAERTRAHARHALTLQHDIDKISG